MKTIKLALLIIFLAASSALAQISTATLVKIVKAEDARRYDATLEGLMKSSNTDIRRRAALAAGRIGDDNAIPALTALLDNDASVEVRAMAAFALGQIESATGADAIINALIQSNAAALTGETRAAGSVSNVTPRLVEAAGKIAAANPKDPKTKELSKVILDTLKAEDGLGIKRARDVVLAALTAALRAKPAGADAIVAKFLNDPDARIRADAGNTLTRLHAKNANAILRSMLANDTDPIARANAARTLGAAEDKDALDVLLKAATSDSDQRVRISAIRALGALKDSKAANPLLKRGEILVSAYRSTKFHIPAEQNELLEILISGPRIMATGDEQWSGLFQEFVRFDQLRSSDVYVANMSNRASTNQLVPGPSSGAKLDLKLSDWRQFSTMAQVYGAAAKVDAITDEQKYVKKITPGLLITLGAIGPKPDPKLVKAGPDVLRAYATYKTDELEAVLRVQLASNDVFLRATAVELLAGNFPTHAVRISVENAFKKALTTDKQYNDAQLAMLDAIAKINKAAALDTIYLALDAPDYLVRKKAFELLDDPELLVKFPGVINVVRDAKARHKDNVLSYDPKTGTKLGQVLNTDADYRRALSRKNGTVRAIVTTEKGSFAIDLLPEDAPLTVDNFVKLARSNYFNGLEVHRVVPNFVMQDGDPRGDGNGGPGWSIRCEINILPYDRGAVGMALSGKDTGGSQWFVTHSPQPHLDGGYTVFGHVNETDMKVVDNIVRGDKIISVKIVERVAPRSRRGH